MADEKKLLEKAFNNLHMKTKGEVGGKTPGTVNEPECLNMRLDKNNPPSTTLEQIRDYIAKTDLPSWEVNHLRDEINRILNYHEGNVQINLHGNPTSACKPDHIKNTQQDNDEHLGTSDIRSYNIGDSDYSKHKIQPWDIWEDYKLNPWDADIVKRTLRTKQEPGKSKEESRILDYRKIIHVAQERIRQIQTNGHV